VQPNHLQVKWLSLYLQAVESSLQQTMKPHGYYNMTPISLAGMERFSLLLQEIAEQE
jgi:hypothetical protein